jgi:hypothetical protein
MHINKIEKEISRLESYDKQGTNKIDYTIVPTEWGLLVSKPNAKDV